jgi:hypothetical protein
MLQLAKTIMLAQQPKIPAQYFLVYAVFLCGYFYGIKNNL